MATGPRSTFTKKLAEIKTAAAEEVYWAITMTVDKCDQCQVWLPNAETEATGGNIADKDRVVPTQERLIYRISSKDQMWFMTEFRIQLVQFIAWWQAISVQELWKTIQLCALHLRYPKIHVLSLISESIWLMGPGDNFISNISEHLHIGNVKEP